MKEKNIFFLIEHQSKVDYSMPYRIEEYRLEIIKSAIDVKKIKNKGYEIPEVIPIVIYTGKRQWNAKLYLHSIQDERFKNVNLQRYNLIDINNYKKETLIKSDYLIDKMFLLEKSKNEKELEEAITSTRNKEDRQKLLRIIQKTLKEKISEARLKELKKNEKEGEEIMEEILDRIITYEKMEARKKAIKEGLQEGLQKGMQKGMQKGIQKGRKEERKNIIKSIINNMLNKGIDVDGIKELTGIEKDEIEKIKKMIKG